MLRAAGAPVCQPPPRPAGGPALAPPPAAARRAVGSLHQGAPAPRPSPPLAPRPPRAPRPSHPPRPPPPPQGGRARGPRARAGRPGSRSAAAAALAGVEDARCSEPRGCSAHRRGDRSAGGRERGALLVESCPRLRAQGRSPLGSVEFSSTPVCAEGEGVAGNSPQYLLCSQK